MQEEVMREVWRAHPDDAEAIAAMSACSTGEDFAACCWASCSTCQACWRRAGGNEGDVDVGTEREGDAPV